MHELLDEMKTRFAEEIRDAIRTGKITRTEAAEDFLALAAAAVTVLADHGLELDGYLDAAREVMESVYDRVDDTHKDTPWILVNSQDGKLHCKRCGASADVNEGLPMEILAWVRKLRRWARPHRACVERPAAEPTP